MKVWQAPQEELMVIRMTIRTRTETPKAPCIDKTDERVVIAIVEVFGQYFLHKLLGLQDTPRSTVRHPRDYVGELGVGQHCVELDRKLLMLHGGRGWDGVGDSAKYSFAFIGRYS